MDLIGDDSNELGKISINKKYAEKFERESRFRDLQRSAELGLLDDEDEEDSSDDEEDDDAVALSQSLDKQIIRTINLIRKKDPKIYDKSAVWFEENDDEEDGGQGEEGAPHEKKRYKDIVREQLLEDEDGVGGKGSAQSRLAYDAEQASLRKSLLESIHGGVDNEGEEEEGDDMLKPVVKSSGELAQEDAELAAELEEMRRLGKCRLEDPSADDFLFEYISKQRWKDKTAVVDSNVDEDSDEEEARLDETDRFESSYNFRFEEAGADAGQIVGHARLVNDSVRRPDTKRKEQREKRAERKERERRHKEEELRRLKNLKRQELQDRLRKIGDTGGLSDMGIDEAELEEEWDPARHEELMREQFGDAYYAEEDEGFDEDAAVQDGDWGVEPDDDEGAGLHAARPSARAKDSLDELYALDYEDVVAGVPTRFRYRQVEAEDWGLTAEDILLAEDRDLSKFVGLKRLSTYRADKIDANKLSKKRKRLRALVRERMDSKGKGGDGPAQVEEEQEQAQVLEKGAEEGLVDAGKRKRKRRTKKAADSSSS